MDDLDRELVSLLCTKIGMLMEDNCTRALVVASNSPDEQRAIVHELIQASDDIKALARAAKLVAG